MPEITARVQCITPWRFTSTNFAHSDGSIAAKGRGTNAPTPALPALFTRMSTGPSSRRARSIPAATAEATVTSKGTAAARSPADLMRSATRDARSSWKSFTATAAPWRARSMAMPSPVCCAAPVTSATLTGRPARAPALLHEHLGARQPLRLAGGVVELEGDRAVDDRIDLAVRIEVHVGAVHLEEDARLVLDAVERVDRPGGLVEERAGAVHVLVLLVLPGAREGVAPDGPGVAVGLHLVAGLEDVLDDPEPLAALHLEHLELGAAADVDEGKLARADVDRRRMHLARHLARLLAAPDRGSARRPCPPGQPPPRESTSIGSPTRTSPGATTRR